jgi:hypothetical protein
MPLLRFGARIKVVTTKWVRTLGLGLEGED